MPAHTPTREPVIAYIALGANLGDARSSVLRALETMAAQPGLQLLARSSLYRSAPVQSCGEDYINAVVKVLSSLPAYSLLSLLQKIEQATGRERPFHNAPRTLDLDVLLYGSATIQSERLTVPHPRMLERAFVLLPLREIAPEIVSEAQLAAVTHQAITKLDV